MILHRQDSVHVVRLQVKIAGQGEQRSTQSARSAVQSRLQGQALAHEVETPSQVTDPRWPTEQFWSTAEQLPVPLQLIATPDPQLAEAVQEDLPAIV